MDISELMERIDGAEHFGNVESSMTVRKDASVIE
jgi:hypothetical protein